LPVAVPCLRLPLSHLSHARPFLCYCYGAHRDLHSFPTRRSSDLRAWIRGRRRGNQRRPRCASWAPSIATGTTGAPEASASRATRSEEHTSELQSRFDLVCRLLLEKKKHKTRKPPTTHKTTTLTHI